MTLPLKWEFPGGKIEEGESPEDCVKREINEELNIVIEVYARLPSSFHQYGEVSVELIPFQANLISGEIHLAEHKQYLLLNPNDLTSLDLAEADIAILKEIIMT